MNEMPPNLEELVKQNQQNIGLDPALVARLQSIVLSGKNLDNLANYHGLQRIKKKFLWIFTIKESDKKLLARVIAFVKGL